MGHSNELHVHTQSVLSGVFYLTDSKYPITFQHPFEDINNYFWKSEVIGNCNTINSCFWSIPPKRNLLIIFPSWLKHKVELNKDETERVSISFNTQVANEQGKPKSLTQKQFNNAMDEVMKEVNKK